MPTAGRRVAEAWGCHLVGVLARMRVGAGFAVGSSGVEQNGGVAECGPVVAVDAFAFALPVDPGGAIFDAAFTGAAVGGLFDVGAAVAYPCEGVGEFGGVAMGP